MASAGDDLGKEPCMSNSQIIILTDEISGPSDYSWALECQGLDIHSLSALRQRRIRGFWKLPDGKFYVLSCNFLFPPLSQKSSSSIISYSIHLIGLLVIFLLWMLLFSLFPFLGLNGTTTEFFISKRFLIYSSI